MEPRIVDRNIETEILVNSINNSFSKKESCAYFLVADTGFGKSSIVQKAQNSKNLMIDLITVETPPINKNQATLEGQYISYIAAALDKCGKCISLKDYIYHSSHQTLKEFETILDSGHTATSAALAFVGHQCLRELSSERMFLNLDSDSILTLKEYIMHNLAQQRFALSISNAQNMDGTSFRVIQELYRLLDPLFVIFEYTTFAQNCDELHIFSSAFHVPVKYQTINALPLEYALTLVNPQTQNEIKEFESFYTNIINGNLYRLEQGRMDTVDGKYNFKEDPIKAKLAKLSYGAKLVLAIIMFHDGDIELTLLQEIIDSFSDQYHIMEDWQNELETVLENKHNGRIELKHASILDTFSLNAENYAAMAAYRYIEPYYRKKCTFCKGVELQKSVIILLKMYALFNSENLSSLLERFKNVIISSLSEEDAFSFVKKNFDAIAQNQNRSLQIELVNICYNMGLYKGAQSLIENLFPLNNPYEKALYCALLNRNDFHQQAIDFCRKEEKKTNDPHAILLFSMIRMLSERSLNHTRKCRWIYNKLRWTLRYHKYLEYGFLLRNSQIVLGYEKSIPLLQKSVSFFEERKQKNYMAMSQLTLLIQNARIGNISNAHTELKHIHGLLENESFEKHIIYVNEAAIRLLEHKADADTIALLEKAQLTVTTTFDKLIILNNYIATFILAPSLVQDFQIIQEQLLALLEHEPDARMQKKSYTNLYLYYKNIEENSQATFWRKKAIDIHIAPSAPGIEEVLLGERRPRKDEQYLANQKFIAGFITYWHFPIAFDGQ